MADHYSGVGATIQAGGEPPVNLYGARKRSIVNVFTLASQASGDRLYLGELKATDVITDIRVTTDTSLGTATLEVGDGTTANLFAPATTFTATDASTSSCVPQTAELGAATTLWATIGTAALPASGNLVIEVIYNED